MNCIIVDDEPLAREAIEMLVTDNGKLQLVGKFSHAVAAGEYLENNPVDLVFLDIRMPRVTGIDFARTIPKTTLVIFTTAYSEYALDSYEVEAVDYLVKPVLAAKFDRAVEKAIAYHKLLLSEEKENIGDVESDFMFVKSERRFFKVNYRDILFVEGLKDYVIIQQADNRIITKMPLKTMEELLPPAMFLRVNRSYIVNTEQIDSFDNNDVFIGKHEIAIGSSYRDLFFEKFVNKRS